ncbi:MAG: hypothetical protein KBG28_27655 [Kofleriaceae bacterium]|jgi:predicted  nucleic acid-binding Zn-ribbon protein|nr:hypothetical protein [Kofleriaceae bacterium]MBP6840066.1 hypothetical protein [Kofleriaceae bacterium]MBP9207771.1 hypothetical protein [Kofleriaceae bacterium]
MSVTTGSDIEALCSKCGDVWHVVVAMVGSKVVKVHCKECGAEHRYKTADGKHLKTPAKSKVARPAKAPVERFDTPRVAADLNKPVRTYAASEAFAIGERVEHPSFGQGVVEVLDGAKMTVFFAVGRKVLVCARAGTVTGLSRPKPFDHANPPAGGKPVGNQ